MADAAHLKLVKPAGLAGAWLEAVGSPGWTPVERGLLERAASWAMPRLEARILAGGEPATAHAAGVAGILHGLELDADTCAASLLAGTLSAAEDAPALAEVRAAFGMQVAALAEGVARMAAIDALGRRAAQEDRAAQLESLRKMLLAMAQDVRVVLIKLADHVQTLRYAVKCRDDALRRDAAQLALDIFAPLANRLGVWQLKWELEDLSLRIIEPDTYKRIAGLLDARRDDRRHDIEDVIARLRAELAQAGLRADVSGRPKHIYSIYNKMRRKGVDFDAIYDVRAVRVLVDDVKECYTVLGIVHSLWTPLAREFDDYIARPKGNFYRSLHTAVIGPGGKPLEIQIRTREMHREAEFGIASHWRYKEGALGKGGRKDSGFDDRIAWLRQMLEWKDEVADSRELGEQFRSELFADTIYVLTPQGRVIDLPKDATPVDFAYHVHSDLGHRCRGAKVDGAIVPLNTPLRSGQQVEILAAKQGGPSRDWLTPALGYIRSASARARVRQWFNRRNFEESVADGRETVEKELQRHGLTRINLDKLARDFGFDRVEDFFAEVARGKIGPRQVVNRITGVEPPEEEAAVPAEAAPAAPQAGGILIVGVDRLLTVPARCCKPAPPDPIVGFITRGRGVTIHRKTCVNVPRLAPERLIAADWGARAGARFPVDVVLEADDRNGLLREIAETLAQEQVNVGATRSASRDGSLRVVITVDIGDLEQLNRILGRLREVPGVRRAARR